MSLGKSRATCASMSSGMRSMWRGGLSRIAWPSAGDAGVAAWLALRRIPFTAKPRAQAVNSEQSVREITVDQTSRLHRDLRADTESFRSYLPGNPKFLNLQRALLASDDSGRHYRLAAAGPLIAVETADIRLRPRARSNNSGSNPNALMFLNVSSTL